MRKRSLEVDLSLCIFCQRRNKAKEDVRKCTEHSKSVVLEATVKRKSLRDVDNCDAIDRVEEFLYHESADVYVVWHGTCYSNIPVK